MKKATHEFDVLGASIKINGDGALLPNTEFEHDEEVYVVARVRISEIAFPRNDKKETITRVHKGKFQEAFVVEAEAEAAEKLMGPEREKFDGQGNLLAMNGSES